MEEEFDFDGEELGFEDFDGDFDEFEDYDADDIFVRTAVLSKNNMIALLSMKTATEGGAIYRVDPREAQPAVQLYDDPEKAVEWFNKSLRTSRQNGWNVLYDGLPLQG
jgi:hypothetical protein